MSNNINSYKKVFTPIVKFKSKLVNLCNIKKPDDKKTQCRVYGLSTKHVTKLELSIGAVGLKNKISVEVLNWNGDNPDRSTYILRDGDHRFEAIRNLHKQFPKKYEHVECEVFERHSTKTADQDWLFWQHTRNDHLDKVHMNSSFNDIVHVISRLLMEDGYCNIATKHVLQDNWSHASVESAIRSFIDTHCKGRFKGRSNAQKDELVSEVYRVHGQTYKSKIKRYARQELNAVLANQFGVKRPGGISACGTTRVWMINNNDWDKQINSPLRALISGNNDKNLKNKFIFHSKQTDPDQIATVRDSVLDKIKEINSWFGKYVKDHQNGVIIDELYFLGQLVGFQKNKENEFQLIKQSI